MEEPADMAPDSNRDSGSFDSACVGVSDDELAGRRVATPPVDGFSATIGSTTCSVIATISYICEDPLFGALVIPVGNSHLLPFGLSVLTSSRFLLSLVNHEFD